MRDLDPSLIEDHQIWNLVPIASPKVILASSAKALVAITLSPRIVDIESNTPNCLKFILIVPMLLELFFDEKCIQKPEATRYEGIFALIPGLKA